MTENDVESSLETTENVTKMVSMTTENETNDSTPEICVITDLKTENDNKMDPHAIENETTDDSTTDYKDVYMGSETTEKEMLENEASDNSTTTENAVETGLKMTATETKMDSEKTIDEA